MASDAIGSVGIKFYREDPTSLVYATLAEITGIGGLDSTRDTHDVTNFDSPDGYREFIASFKDGGEVSLEMNFTNATYKTVGEDFESNDKVNYRITIPDGNGSQLDFAGLLTTKGFSAPVDDKVSSNVAIKISGKVTFSDDLA